MSNKETGGEGAGCRPRSGELSLRVWKSIPKNWPMGLANWSVGHLLKPKVITICGKMYEEPLSWRGSSITFDNCRAVF